jgi:hypothetical protein
MMGTYLKPLLVFGAVLLLVVIVSWLAFPGWHTQPGGMWTLIGLAVVAVLAIARDALDIAKTWQEINTPAEEEKEPPPQRPNQKQTVRDSEDVMQRGKRGGTQEQDVEGSKGVTQEMT